MASDLYNSEQELEFASMVASKEIGLAFSEGEDISEAREKSQHAFSETLQSRALAFLQNLRISVSKLSNKDITNLLMSLLLGGFKNEETETEIKKWVLLLGKEGYKRLIKYRSPYTQRRDEEIDIDGCNTLLQTIKLVHKKNKPEENSAEMKKWMRVKAKIENVQQIINDDIKEMKAQMSVYNFKNI